MRVRLKLNNRGHVISAITAEYMGSVDWIKQRIGEVVEVEKFGDYWYKAKGTNYIIHKSNVEEVVVDLKVVVMRNLGDYVLKNITSTEELYVVLLTYFAEAAAHSCLEMYRDGVLECSGRYYLITIDLVLDMFIDELSGFDHGQMIAVDEKYGICSRFRVDTGVIEPSKVVVE